MTSKLKVLGLAFVALFAMSAITASAASATPAHFTVDSLTSNAFLTGFQDPAEPEQIFITEFGEVNCNIVSAKATAPKTSETIETSEVKYTSNYFGNTKCEAFGLEAEINFNGCNYLFHAGEFVSAGHSTGSVDLVCPSGKSVKIITPTCTVTVAAQAGLGPVTYTQVGSAPSDITLDAEIEGIAYSGSGATCSGSFNEGIYFGKATIKAYEDNGSEGAQVSATITST